MAKIRCWECINNVCVEKPRCSINSCKIDCATSPDGFCCIQNSSINRLLQVMGLVAGQLSNQIDICQTKSECEETCGPSIQYGIIWNWTQSCNPTYKPINYSVPMKYNDLRPSDTINSTKLSSVGCGNDYYTSAINNRTGRNYPQPYEPITNWLSFEGGNIRYQIVKVSDYPNIVFGEGD